LKLLFFLRTPTNLRNVDSVVRGLAARGHEIHIAYERQKKDQPDQIRQVEALSADYPNVTYGRAPKLKGDRRFALSTRLRFVLDYLRYLEPRYRDADKLRARVETFVPKLVVAALNFPVLRSKTARHLLAAVVRNAERRIPPPAQVESFIRRHSPDLVLVTPLIHFATPQVEFVRAAKRMGIPTALCVHSWDNLTNKGLIHELPDLVTVWNDVQRDEAVELHGVPPERIVVAGAHSYDHWFAWQPRDASEAFRTRVGLPAERPYLLYLCSSSFIAPQERDFVLEWLRRLRAHPDGRVREFGVLIRPHPVAAAPWRDADVSHFAPAVVYPRAGADPTDASSQSTYFDSLFHCRAVVGINTSAMIESAIVGRPVFTIRMDDFAQDGTLHYEYLRASSGGPVTEAASYDEHFAQLAEALETGESDIRARLEPFVASFIRPHGLDVPGTPRMVAAIEQAGGDGPVRTSEPLRTALAG
jgi:hypothetical protein